MKLRLQIQYNLLFNLKMIKTKFALKIMRLHILMCCVVALCMGGSFGARCKPRTYLHKAMQTDLNGRRCWGEVQIKSCWGYCLSYEISDWQFPYKESHHPVCVHGSRKHALAKLKHCDPGVQSGTEDYHYVEAASCRCQVCSSDDTSCEWLPPDSLLLGGLVLKEELQEEIAEDDD